MWSKELKDYTLEHFGESGVTFLKSFQPSLYAVGVDRNLMSDDSLDKVIPEEYRKHSIVLLNRDGMGFLKAYMTVNDMVDDGWAID